MYMDFAYTMLNVKAKITQADGTNLAVDSPIRPGNLFLQSLFSQVDVSLNGTLITASTNTYSYRAVLEKILSYDLCKFFSIVLLFHFTVRCSGQL